MSEQGDTARLSYLAEGGRHDDECLVVSATTFAMLAFIRRVGALRIANIERDERTHLNA